MNQVIAIIPHYNHSDTIGNVVEQLLALELSVLIVDDGSSAEHVAVLKKLENPPKVIVHYCPQNSGKGAAMKVGFTRAFNMGFTHAIQVDADGQHHLPDIQQMLLEMQKNPTATLFMAKTPRKPAYTDAKSPIFGTLFTPFPPTLKMECVDSAYIR